MVMSFCAVLFPRGVLDEILSLIESVSEDFPSYSCTARYRKVVHLVGCFGLHGPLRQYFSLYRAVSKREDERNEK